MKNKSIARRINVKKKLSELISFMLILICTSCQNNPSKIKGRWACIQSNAIYEFSNGTFILSTSLLDSSLMIRGPYRFSDEVLITKANELSYDFGETWEENDGSLIPSSETKQSIDFPEPDRLILSGIEYVKF
ncbi:MAG: hypothetical protein II547_10020 [Treponema sp.]|nr:hypothetical protein [Treponema sp.]